MEMIAIIAETIHSVLPGRQGAGLGSVLQESSPPDSDRCQHHPDLQAVCL